MPTKKPKAAKTRKDIFPTSYPVPVVLFDKLTVGRLTLKNRIVFPPMATARATPDGAINERHLAKYTALARGGTGLVIFEHTYVEPRGRFRPVQPGIHDDSLIPGLRRLTGEVHRAGAAIGIQLGHVGAMASPLIIGEKAVAPSDVRPPVWSAPFPQFSEWEAPRALRRDELSGIVTLFARAAERAVEAGFDAVEIHAAHGYLLSQFLSPLTNHRDDEYGGSLANRFRLVREILVATRSRLPKGMPILIRLGADDLLSGGLRLEDSIEATPELLAAGADVIDVSSGMGGWGEGLQEQGFFVPLARAIREATGAVVIGVGNISDPAYANELVRQGQVDLVAVGRAMLKDTGWANKAAGALSRQ